MADNSNRTEIDIDKIMERIRAEVSRRRGDAAAPAAAEPQEKKADSAGVDTSMIGAIISSAEASADIVRVPSMLRFRGFTRKLAVFAAGKITYLSSFITNKQRNFNLTVIHALKTITDGLGKINERTEALAREDADLRKAAEETKHHLTAVESALAESLNTKQAEIKGEIENVSERLDRISEALKSGIAEQAESKTALQKELYEKAAKIEGLENTISRLKHAINKQERDIAIFLEEAKKRLPEHFSVEDIRSLAAGDEHRFDLLYASFEELFRGTRTYVKENVRAYLPYIKKVKAGTDEAPLIDIGCGRGEWLELLKENGLKARGIDINGIFLNQCRERGLDVIESDAILYLRSLPDSSLGALTALHIIEHLPFKMLISLLDETVRVLRPGGIAILETPNPDNILVGCRNFYLDPTHRKPLPSDMIKFMAEARGLSGVEILNLHPDSDAKRLSGSDVAERFNKYFYGPQDYAVIGYKL